MAVINMSHPDQSQHNRTKTFHECLFTRREAVFLIFNFRVNNSCQLTCSWISMYNLRQGDREVNLDFWKCSSYILGVAVLKTT